MGWTYSGNPSSSAKDEVRFLIGDTDSSDRQLMDEEIDYLVTISADDSTTHNYMAAVAACDAIAAKYAKLMDKTVGSLSITYSQKYQHYSELSDKLYGMATKGVFARKPGPPRLGGGGQKFLDKTPDGSDWDATT